MDTQDTVPEQESRPLESDRIYAYVQKLADDSRKDRTVDDEFFEVWAELRIS